MSSRKIQRNTLEFQNYRINSYITHAYQNSRPKKCNSTLGGKNVVTHVRMSPSTMGPRENSKSSIFQRDVGVDKLTQKYKLESYHETLSQQLQ